MPANSINEGSKFVAMTCGAVDWLRHTMPVNSINERSKCVSMTRHAKSARPYNEKFELQELVRGGWRLEPLLGHLEVGHTRRGPNEHMRRQEAVVPSRHQATWSLRTSTRTDIEHDLPSGWMLVHKRGGGGRFNVTRVLVRNKPLIQTDGGGTGDSKSVACVPSVHPLPG